MFKRVILIVDDDNVTVKFVRSLLINSGYNNILTASNGHTAIEICKKNPVDLILMNIMLDDEMDGIITTNYIHEFSNTPVIFISANSEEETFELVNTTKNYGYLIKPLNKNLLVYYIKSAFDRYELFSKLQQSEERYRILFEAPPEGMIVHDNTTIIDINRNAETLFNTSRESIISKKITGFIAKEDRNRFLNYINKQTNQALRIKLSPSLHHTIDIELLNKKIINKKNRFDILVIRSTSEYKKNVSILRNDEEKYRALIENSTDIIMRINKALRFIYISPSVSNFFNFAPDDFTGKNLHELDFPKDLVINIEQTLQYVFHSREPFESEFEFKTKSGVKIFNWRLIPELNRMNQLLTIMIIARDVTKEKKAESRIRILTNELINSQEQERQHIAKDLHDSVTQTILAAKLNFSEFRKDPENSRNRFDMGLECITRAAEELREIYTGIYPTILNDIGLEATIRWYAKNYLEVNGIMVIINYEINDELQHNLKITFYRIVQELLSNILKHSKADRATVTFQCCDDHIIQLTITDNGTGFNVEKLNSNVSNFGLNNIQHRCELLNGTTSIHTKYGKGTTTIIRIPEQFDGKNKNNNC